MSLADCGIRLGMRELCFRKCCLETRALRMGRQSILRRHNSRSAGGIATDCLIGAFHL